MFLRILAGTVAAGVATGTAVVVYNRSDPNYKDRYDASYARALACRAGAEVDARMRPHKVRLFDGLKQLSSGADGKLVVAEIACGGCHNFRYYPAGTEALCVDVNRHFEPYARAAADRWPNVHVAGFYVASAEDMKGVLGDAVADAAVVTESLCNIDNVDVALAEIRRILKPGGKLFFVEHVLAGPEYPFVRLLQRVVNPVWRIMSGGCNCNRQYTDSIRSAGFSSVELKEFEAFELTKPTRVFFAAIFLRSHIMGTATK